MGTFSHTNGRRQTRNSGQRDGPTHGDVSEPSRSRRDAPARSRAVPITDGPYAESKEMLGGSWIGRRVFAEEL